MSIAQREVQSEQLETKSQKSVGTSKVSWILLVATSIAAAVVVFLVPYIPGHDGPHHIYLAHLANQFSQSGSIYPRFYRPGVPVTALGYTALGAPLQDLLGWLRGYQVYLAILVQVWGWGTVALFRVIDRRRAWLGMIGFVLAFQWSLYMGFYSFMMGMALGLFTIAIAISEQAWTPRRRLAITGLLLAQAFAHIFAAELTAVVLIALVLARSQRGSRIKQLGWLALMGVPAMLVAVAASTWVTGASPTVLSNDKMTIPLTWLQKLALAGHCFAGGPLWRSLIPVVAALAGAGFVIADWRSGERNRTKLALLVSGLGLLVLFAIVPVNFKLWQFVSPRFLPLGVTMLLGLLPVERLSSKHRGALAARVGLVVYVVVAFGWTASFHKTLWKTVKPVVHGAQARVYPHRLMLPLPLSVEIPGKLDERQGPYAFYAPFIAMGDLFATANNGVVPYTFTVIRQLHGFTLRDDIHKLFPPHPVLGDWREAYGKAIRARNRPAVLSLLNLLALYGSEYDGVLLLDATNEHLLFQQRGYHVSWHEGRVWELTYQGCPVRVVVHSADSNGRSRAASVDYSRFPLQAHRQAPLSAPNAAGDMLADIPSAPCGLVQLRVNVPVTSVRGSVQLAHCQGADSSGAIVVKLKPGVSQVACVLDSPAGSEASATPRHN